MYDYEKRINEAIFPGMQGKLKFILIRNYFLVYKVDHIIMLLQQLVLH